MNRTAIIVISLIVAVALGVIVFWMISASTQPIQQDANTTPGTSDQSTDSEASPVPQNEPSDSTPAAQSATVSIENSSYVASAITVKKGTTVTWTNKDDMGHNVVSDSGAPAGGPPATNELLNKDETYSFTFDTVGTFPYHCSAHPFMQGTVTVTE